MPTSRSSIEKSFLSMYLGPSNIGQPKIPGQVPGRQRLVLDGSIDPARMPPKQTPAMILDPEPGPFHSAEDAVKGLGLPHEATGDLAAIIRREATATKSELTFRRAIAQHLVERFPHRADLRRAALRRAAAYYRGRMHKGHVDQLPGGLADNMTPEDFDGVQLRIGTEHEEEHTCDPDLAREIAMDHLAEDPEYYTKLKLVMKAQSFKPPQSVRNNAKRGLELRRKHGRGGLDTAQAGKQGIGSGVQRASDLASGDSLSLATVRKMHGFFSRHEKNKDSREEDGSPGAGMIAWLLWGGDSGRRWAASIMKREMEKAEQDAKHSKPPLVALALGRKLQTGGRAPPVGATTTSRRQVPAGTIHVHFSSEHHGYVRAMKRADGTWKVLGKVGEHGHDHEKHRTEKPKDGHRMTVHHDERRAGNAEHHSGEHVVSKAETAPKEHRETGATERSDYADPEGFKYPIHRESNVRAAISYFHRFGGAYPVAKRTEVWARIKSAAEKFKIDVGEEPEHIKKASAAQAEGAKMNDVMKAIMNRDVGAELSKALGEGHESSEGMPAAPSTPQKILSPTEDHPVNQQMEEGEAEQPATAPVAMAKGAGAGMIELAQSSAHADPYARPGYRPGATQFDEAGDIAIAKAMEQHGLALGGNDPAVEYSVVKGGNQCGDCGSQFAKAVTVCPGCGVSSGVAVGSASTGVALSKSVASTLQPPVAQLIQLID